MGRSARVAARLRWEGSPTSLDYESKRQAIISTAIKLFAQKGFASVSIDEIARELRISKPTIYYYAGNKEELFQLCRFESVDMLIKSIVGSITDDMMGRDKTEIMIGKLAHWVATDAARFNARHILDEPGSAAAERLRVKEREVDKLLQQAIQDGVDDGSLRKLDVKYSAAAIIGAFSWAAFWFDPERRTGGVAELHQTFADIIMKGLGVPEPTTRRRKARRSR